MHHNSAARALPGPLMTVEVSWRIRTPWHAVPLLRQVALYVMRAEGFRTGRLSVAVVGAAAMSTLHERYLGQPGPTDVLTFDFGTDRRRRIIQGEIVLCADVARRTAGAVGAGLGPARAELALYLTHGILHLAGYDDARKAAFQRMHAREDALLRRLNLGAVFREGAQRRRRARLR